MRTSRKICLIPIYGSILYFFIITIRLARIGKRSIKMEFCYLGIMALLGSIGMIMSGLFLKQLQINLEERLLLYYIISILLVWPLITLPVIEYSKKANQIFKNTKQK